MATPQPNQIQQYYPVGGELKYLFTKTMTQDDMLGLGALVGDSKSFLTSLPKPMLDEIGIRGLLDRANFRLEKIAWAEFLVKSDFKA